MLKQFYNKYIRSHVPESSRICVRNGVAVRGTTKITDQTDHLPEHEAFVGGKLREVKQDDSVVIIGGGYGVTTVIAARNGKRVITYEASDNQFSRLTSTISLNKVGEKVDLRHKIVSNTTSHNTSKYGGSSADTIRPSEIPRCDVLQMDCEGAEKDILNNMEISPSKIIVETHGFLGSTKSDVEYILREEGYRVVDQKEEIPEDGIIQIVAELDNN